VPSHLKTKFAIFHLKLWSIYLNICNIDIRSNLTYFITRIITHRALLNQDTVLQTEKWGKMFLEVRVKTCIVFSSGGKISNLIE